MNMFSSAAFWGVVIILIGVSILLREVFGIHFPFFKLILGLFLIYLGIRVITGGGFWHNRQDSNEAIFSNAHMEYNDNQSSYSIIFGNGTVDFFKMDSTATPRNAKVDVIFGNGRIILNDNLPAKIMMNTAFGRVVAPGRSTDGFGDNTFTTSAFKEDQPYTLIKASSVFGKIDIEAKKW